MKELFVTLMLMESLLFGFRLGNEPLPKMQIAWSCFIIAITLIGYALSDKAEKKAIEEQTKVDVLVQLLHKEDDNEEVDGNFDDD